MALNELTEQTGFSFFILFTLSACLSKAASNIFGGILLLLSVIYLAVWMNNDLKENKRFIYVFLLPLMLGFAISFFSLSGLKGASSFLERYRFFLLILPFLCFVDTESKVGVLFLILNVSAFIGAIYGFFYFRYSNVNIWEGFVGLQACGRNSDLMMTIGLINMAAVLGYKWPQKRRNILLKSIISVNTVLLLGVVLILGRRASYIGFLIGLFVILFSFRKKFIVILMVIAFIFPVFIADTWVKDRMKSIVDVAHNVSNVARIQIYKTGCDYLLERGMFFRGTGAKKSETPFSDFYVNKPPEYKAAYSEVPKYFGEFHNSYLQIAVEDGVFFLFALLSSIVYLIVMMISKIHDQKDNHRVYPLCAIGVTCGFFVTQFFHNDLYSYGGIPFLLAFLSGISVDIWYSPIKDRTADSNDPLHSSADSSSYL